jgi:hypothetical protein
MEILINSLIALANKDSEIAPIAIAHAEKIINALQSGQYTADQYNRDFAIGMEILQGYIDKLGNIIEDTMSLSEYISVSI